MKLDDLGQNQIIVRNPAARSEEKLPANLLTPFTRHGYTVVMCLGMSTEFGMDTRLFVFGKELSLSTSQLVCEPLSPEEQHQFQVDLIEALGGTSESVPSIYFDGNVVGIDTFACAQFLGLAPTDAARIRAASD